MSQPSNGRNDQGERQPQRSEQRYQQPAQQTSQSGAPHGTQPAAQHGTQRGYATTAPKSKAPWIVAGVVAVVAIAAIGYMLLGGKATIPAAVLGQQKDIAEAQIRSAGFQVAASPTFQEDANKPDGIVLDTIPKPGTKLKAGEQVTLVLNRKKLIADKNENKSTNTNLPSTDKPATDKPATDKPATDKPATDKKPGPDIAELEMPAITGKAWTTARTELTAKGFAEPDYKITKNSVFDETIGWDQVVSSNPPKGVKVPKGTPIQVKVNDGYAEMPSGLVNTEFDPAAKTKLENAGFVVSQSPAEPRETIKTIRVGNDQVRDGDKLRKGSQLTLVFATASVNDTILSPIGKSEDDAKTEIETQIAALSSKVNVTVKYELVADPAARGKVVRVTKGIAEIKTGLPLDLKGPGDIELTVQKNPAKWKIDPSVVQPSKGAPFTLTPLNGGIRVTPKINGTSVAGIPPQDVSTSALAIDTSEVKIPAFVEFAVAPEDYVAGELTFAVEVNFKDDAGNTLSGTGEFIAGSSGGTVTATGGPSEIIVVFNDPQPIR